MRVNDYIGKTYGRLTIIGKDESNHSRHTKVIIRCRCGNVTSVYLDNIVQGRTKSCGCLIHDVLVRRNYVHGLKRDRLYIIWKTMRQRCKNPNKEHYDRYGGRGIKICDEWNNYANFYKWAMQSGYAENLSIDRIDNDGDYTPQNCRWITQKEQMGNTKVSIHIEYNGETHTISEWSEITGLKYGTIYQRYRKGWPIQKVLSK